VNHDKSTAHQGEVTDREPPPTEERRPPEGTGAQQTTSTTSTDIVSDAETVPMQLRRRRATAWRCEPLRCGRRDPNDPQRSTAVDSSASDFGLSRGELRAYARALYRAGWDVAEIVQVLDVEPVTP
jgi:hypothetical protein